ncbi:transketolase, C-terminal subunit [Clostridia bacterium]|nr:transketolase, C-terminal subunit [Clostridia bacterium]
MSYMYNKNKQIYNEIVMNNPRAAFAAELLCVAQENPRVFAICTDSRGSAALNTFAETLPGQFVECGIAEQNAVSVAAGLTSADIIPFVCGPASFLSLRSAEQVKVDASYSGTNVKIIGVSGGVSYGALGYSHHALQDVALMRAIAGMTVIIPADARQAAVAARALAGNSGPVYLRMGRSDVPDVYSNQDTPFEIGKANQLFGGTEHAELTIIACGEMIYSALEASSRLLDMYGIHSNMFDMHTIEPLDTEALTIAAETGCVITVEEHDVHGGLGAAVSEWLSQNKPARLRIMGLPHEHLLNGTSTDIFNHYHLTSDGIARAAIEMLEVKQ